MKTFEQFLSDSAGYGGLNVVFEAGMYSLTNDLEQIINALRDAGVDFEVIGGVAVNIHIVSAYRSRSFVTRDIDVLIRRSDLDSVAKAGASLGYRAKKIVGGYTLIRPGQDLAEAVHLLFVGEVSKSTQPVPHPELHPEEKDFLGIKIPVAPMKDLVQMKLSSFRPKDLVHLEILDEVGLITPELERQLPTILLERLKDARRQIEENKPDVDE